MVPFSFHQPLLKLQVMKRRSLPSSPLAGAKQAHLTLDTWHLTHLTPNWVQRHAGAGLPQLKKLPSLPMLPSKISLSPIPFQKPTRHPLFSILAYSRFVGLEPAHEKRLQRLADLHDKNLISPTEYETKRQQILNEI